MRNAAYDLSLFEERKKKLQQPKHEVNQEKRIIEVKKRPKSHVAVSFKTMLLAIFLVGILSISLFSRAQLTELTSRTNAAKAAYNEAVSENEKLTLQLNSLVSRNTIEQIALTELNLVETRSDQTRYVNLSSGGIEKQSTDSSIFTEVFNDILKFLGF